jgi:hypothetical protein
MVMEHRGAALRLANAADGAHAGCAAGRRGAGCAVAHARRRGAPQPDMLMGDRGAALRLANAAAVHTGVRGGAGA